MIGSLYFFLLYTDAKATQTVNNDQVEKKQLLTDRNEEDYGKETGRSQQALYGMYGNRGGYHKALPKVWFCLIKIPKAGKQYATL